MEGGKSWNQLSAFSLEDPENELELPEVGTPSDMRSDKLFKDYKNFQSVEKCFDGGAEDCGSKFYQLIIQMRQRLEDAVHKSSMNDQEYAIAFTEYVLKKNMDLMKKLRKNKSGVKSLNGEIESLEATAADYTRQVKSWAAKEVSKFTEYGERSKDKVRNLETKMEDFVKYIDMMISGSSVKKLIPEDQEIMVNKFNKLKLRIGRMVGEANRAVKNVERQTAKNMKIMENEESLFNGVLDQIKGIYPRIPAAIQDRVESGKETLTAERESADQAVATMAEKTEQKIGEYEKMVEDVTVSLGNEFNA